MWGCKQCGRPLAGLVLAGSGGHWFCNQTCSDRWDKERKIRKPIPRRVQPEDQA